MNCCQPSTATLGTNKFFSRQSKRYLKRFRKGGLAREQQYLIEGILSAGVTGKSILDIGCGIGGIHFTLLKQGALSAIGVEISQGMLDSAKQLSKELGFEKQTSYLRGDFVEMDGQVSQADITVLDKVVCCYENLDALLTASLEKTRNIYALSFPKPTFWIKLFIHIPITLGRLLRWSFRPYWHDWNGMVQMIEEKGFTQRYQKETFLWAVRVFEKK
ncbi:MAG: class I SAM-dependent methyltransferase [Ignavibacteriae bacterium]|nr:class I SAM-dependent methyltransferase [Ignavibacteriota bacterium]